MPPRRKPRATARKSIPKFSPKSSVKSLLAAVDCPDSPPTTTPTAPEPEPPFFPASPKTAPLASRPSPKYKATTPKFSPKSTPLASPVAAAKSIAKSSAGGLSEARATPEATSKSESVTIPPETNPNIDAETTVHVSTDETLAGKAASLTPEDVAIPAAERENVGESGRENVGESGQDGGTMKVAKTVVKRTVRVVKKLVKKKVPKSVPKGQNVSSNEKLEKPETAANEGKSPNPSALGEVEVGNTNPIQSVSMEVENLIRNGSVSMEIENSKSEVTVLLETKNPDYSQSAFASMEVESLNSEVDVSILVENQKGSEVCEAKKDASVNPKESEFCEGEKDASLTENSSEAPVLDSVGTKNNGDEGEMGVSLAETQLVNQNVALVGDQNDECKTENVNSESGKGKEGMKVEVENSEVGGLKVEVGLGDAVVLSGEMEALERQRRRKTEIFIGGLDKDVREEDIRKVFEEVGEVLEVRLMMNGKTRKNKGFAFVRYASAADAKNALAKYPKVEICGKQCGTAPVEGNDTIFLGNIDKKWKSEDIVKLLHKIGIEKIDKVTVMADPYKIDCNRGFAFLELETNKDAQIAYNKLQKKDVFGKHLKIKVAWAEPLIEPDEEEMLKVKSVYAEYIPSSWDEKKVRDNFKRFGEIENVVLARNLRSSRRKDFAFVNYTTREAALACIEAFGREKLNDESSKVNVKVSLAKPIPKGKQMKHISNPTSKELSKEKPKAAQTVIKLHEPRSSGNSTGSNYEDFRVDRRSSMTAELVQLLREQASWRQAQTGSDYPYPSPGMKRPFSVVGDDSLYSDPRGYPHKRFESSYPIASRSALSQNVGMTSSSFYHRQAAGYTSESLYGVEDHPNYFQTRERVPHHGSSGIYRRY